MPYQAGPKAKLLESNEIAKILELEAIVLGQNERASHMIFVQKRGSMLPLCVDYGKVNVVRMRQFYPIFQMGESIHVLGDATIFSVLDANSGYWQVEIVKRR